MATDVDVTTEKRRYTRIIYNQQSCGYSELEGVRKGDPGFNEQRARYNVSHFNRHMTAYIAIE